MFRNMIVTTAFIVCALMLAGAVALGVGFVAGAAGYGYENAGNYSAGGAEIAGPVRNLDIDWINGKVQIAYHSADTVVISETSKREISDDMRLRWWLDGDTLRVHYAKAGLRLSLNQEKELTLTLPEGIALESVSIGATSGALEIPALTAKDLKLETTSGDISAAANAETIRCGATSGNIALTARGDAREIAVGATSGNIAVTAENVGKLSADLTSGDISVTAAKAAALSVGTTSGKITVEAGELGDGEIGSTSGDITVKAGALGSLDIDATSGDVTAYLPSEPGLTAHVDTIGGRFGYGLQLSKDGGKYTCGDGSAKVNIDTTSGNVRIDPIG